MCLIQKALTVHFSVNSVLKTRDWLPSLFNMVLEYLITKLLLLAYIKLQSDQYSVVCHSRCV